MYAKWLLMKSQHHTLYCKQTFVSHVVEHWKPTYVS